MGRPCDNRRDAVRAREEVERAARGRPERRGPRGEADFQYRRESGIGGKAIALIVAAVLLVIFFLQNLENANIDFLFWEWDGDRGGDRPRGAPRLRARVGRRVDAPTGAPPGTARRPARLALDLPLLRQRPETDPELGATHDVQSRGDDAPERSAEGVTDLVPDAPAVRQLRDRRVDRGVERSAEPDRRACHGGSQARISPRTVTRTPMKLITTE